MSKKVKVLIIPTIGLEYEGITSVIYNYMYHMDKENMEIHFVTFTNTKESLLKKFAEIGIVHIISGRKEDTFSYLKGLFGIIKMQFDVVHIHGNSGTMVLEAFLSKTCCVKKIIVHGHNTTCNHKLLNKLLVPLMKCFATEYLACSEMAGKWLYRKNYIVLNNAIDISKYKYNESVRKEYRIKLGIKDECVIGHVGHFTKQKNQEYLVDIFYEFHQENAHSKLLLVSDGPDYNMIVEKVKNMDLEESVIFVGRRSDVDRLYQVMDIFVMPSRWEGLPVVLLETQAAGLPVVASDCITQDAKCTETVYFLSIDKSPKVWVEKIKWILESGITRREEEVQQLRSHHFDITREAQKLKDIYFS